ncbi:hypothetical protein ILUMI_25734 [Ignelater luminosus]|uniref:Uncharacterized protein n=1 Tax=Ignelater luminosus TaxID=2038154 RepID=A0A8K0FZD9_IGNLU|nr:hypothetical protein ILUMI_25734 [Ignelater luminosus]
MDPSDKRHCLLMSITPNFVAKEVVESLPATSEMYDNIIKALKDSVGRYKGGVKGQTQSFKGRHTVKIKHGNHEKIIRALLDSASKQSYIFKSTTKKMNYLPERCEPISTHCSEVTQHDAYTTTLSSLEGDYTYSFKVIDHHKTCGNIAPIPNTLGITDPSEKLSKIELEAATHQNFLDSVKIKEEGHIEVRPPFNENPPPPLSTNYGLAMNMAQLKN